MQVGDRFVLADASGDVSAVALRSVTEQTREKEEVGVVPWVR